MKIVILDDSLSMRMVIEAYLEDLGVHDDEIFSFAKGSDALAFIEKEHPHIIFSDMYMPEMDGPEFVGKLLKKYPHLSASLFIISGEDDQNNLQEMKKAGGKRFIKKPIDINRFNHFVFAEIAKIRLQEEMFE